MEIRSCLQIGQRRTSLGWGSCCPTVREEVLCVISVPVGTCQGLTFSSPHREQAPELNFFLRLTLNFYSVANQGRPLLDVIYI